MNCPHMTEVFGNIINDRIKPIVHSKHFQKLWSLSKDKIKVYQDCEFRYMCSDCRAFLNNINDKPKKCKYLPYDAAFK